ncbi:MAG: GH32 C-terminal domain-containing protein, partial [Chloroflexota bacterium]
PEIHQAIGWAGVQTIPRVLSLSNDNHLLSEPVDTLASIRGDVYHLENIALDDEHTIAKTGLYLDIVAEFNFAPSGNMALRLAMSEDGDAGISLCYDAKSAELTVERHYRDDNPLVESHSHTVVHPLIDGEALQLRILLDGSVLEVIANKRISITSRLYPESKEQKFLHLSGNDTMLVHMDIYDMPSIWSSVTS